MAETFLQQAIDFVTRHRDRPFFLYTTLHQPHVPRLSGPRFRGTTRLGPRGGVSGERDACVGELVNAVDRMGLRERTLILATMALFSTTGIGTGRWNVAAIIGLQILFEVEHIACTTGKHACR